VEDVVSDLLPGAEDVAFADLPAASEAAIATVVIVSPRDRIRDAADALRPAVKSGGVRLILIVAAGEAVPAVRAGADGILLGGLKPEHFNNAVAALRFSSLPTLVWWRGGSPDVLPGLAALADRLVLDALDPREVWRLVPQLVERTAVTDLRWARLTRWRSLMAHFFDLPAVRDAAGTFRSLDVRGSDVYAARLFAGWLASSLRPDGGIAVNIERAQAGTAGTTARAPAIEYVRLANGTLTLTLRLAGNGTCVRSAVERAGGESSQAVSLGDQDLASLIAEELRIRSRDVTFERSVGALRLGGERA
jgi:glucose-6-phosphate dehydrogenase assembly protein OpcA